MRTAHRRLAPPAAGSSLAAANKLLLFLPLTDVKPSNVLISTQGQVKMCDFGISGYLVDSVAKTMDAGCKPYMAVTHCFIQGAELMYCSQADTRGQRTHKLQLRDVFLQSRAADEAHGC